MKIQSRHPFPPHYIPMAILIASGILALLAVVWRLTWLFSTTWPTDYLGFYYLKEIEFRSIYGRGYYEAVSPFFWLCAQIYTLIGIPTTKFFQLLVLITYTLWSMVVVVTTFDIDAPLRKRIQIGVFLLLLIWGSDTFFSVTYSYPRQGIAIALCALGLLLAIPAKHPEAVQNGDRRGLLRVSAGAGLVVCGLLFHILASVVVITMAAAYLLRTGVSKRIAISLIGCAALVFILRFNYQPKNLSVLFQLSPAPIWLKGYFDGWLNLQQCSEYFLAALAGIWIFAGSLRRRIYGLAILAGLFLIIMAPIWDPRTGSYGIRFLLTSSQLFIVLICATIRWPERGAELEPLRLTGVTAVCLLILAVAIPYRVPPIGPRIATAYFVQYRNQIAKWLPQGSFVRAPHGVQYAISYLFDLPSGTQWPRKQRYSLYFEVGGNPMDPETCADVLDATAREIELSCLKIGPQLYLYVVDRFDN